MTDSKQTLQDGQMAEVSGGVWDGTSEKENEYKPHTDPDYPVSCPKCNSGNIWYLPGVFGIHEGEHYWCKGCGLKFTYGQQTSFGASASW